MAPVGVCSFAWGEGGAGGGDKTYLLGLNCIAISQYIQMSQGCVEDVWRIFQTPSLRFPNGCDAFEFKRQNGLQQYWPVLYSNL